MRNRAVLLVVCATTSATLILHLILLNSLVNSDEVFYVTAAETILNHTPCGPIADLGSLQPCNLEHPPLAKLLMAVSIYAFGSGGLGARLPSIISGVLCIPTLSWATWSLSGKSVKATVAAAVLFSTSPVLFWLSSVGMLDSVELLFAVLGLAVYFSEMGRRPKGLALSGALLGLAMLSKEVAALVVAGFVAYLLYFGRWKDAAWILASSSAVAFIGLWAYDYYYTPFGDPIQHVNFILETGLRLTSRAGFAVSPAGWFFQEQELLLALLSLAWVPIALSQSVRKRNGARGILPFALFLLVFTLVPQVLLYYLLHRQEYLFYDLQVLPSLVLGASGLVGSPRTPTLVFILILFASIALFVYFFSFPRSVFAIAILRA